MHPTLLTAHKAITSVRGDLPDEISRPGYLRALRPLERTLKGCCSSFYFEWHLTEPHRTDFLYSVTLENAKLLSDAICGDPSINDDPRWGVVQRFLESWNAVNNRLEGVLPHIWLASDYDVATKKFEPPNLHFCLDPSFTSRGDLPGYRNLMTERKFSRAVSAIADASLTSLPPAVVRSLLKCFRALDAHDGEIVHLSFMHGRMPPVFKLNCTMPAYAAGEVLRSSGRRIDPASVVDIVKEFAPSEERIKCNLRVDAGSCDRFELELEYNTPLKNDPRRKAALASLLRRKLATREQVRCMRTWSGMSRVLSGRSGTPIPLKRWLDIKLVIDDQTRTTAKAYLGFSPLPAIDW